MLVAALVVAGCGSDPADPDPGPTSAELPALRSGHVTRVLGDGSDDILTKAAAVGSSVNRPAALVVTDDGDLLGLQGGFPALFRLAPDGGLTPVPVPTKGASYGEMPPGAAAGTPVAATTTSSSYVVAFDTGTIEVISRDDGSVTGKATVGPVGDTRFAGAFLSLGGTTLLQHGSAWYDVTGLDAAHPSITPADPPLAGVLASAQDGDGALVLTDQQLSRLGADGSTTGAVAWSPPPELKGLALTAATSDGAGGLYVTASPTVVRGSNGSGYVLHVAADGSTTTVAKGARPSSGTGCDDADTTADDAHFAQLVSVVLWQKRLLVADAACGSVLQLPPVS